MCVFEVRLLLLSEKKTPTPPNLSTGKSANGFSPDKVGL